MDPFSILAAGGKIAGFLRSILGFFRRSPDAKPRRDEADRWTLHVFEERADGFRGARLDRDGAEAPEIFIVAIEAVGPETIRLAPQEWFLPDGTVGTGLGAKPGADTKKAAPRLSIGNLRATEASFVFYLLTVPGAKRAKVAVQIEEATAARKERRIEVRSQALG